VILPIGQPLSEVERDAKIFSNEYGVPGINETKHSVDFSAWWPSGWEHGEDTNDVDEDMLRDADERTWPASGGGDYDPTKKCTYQLYWPDTQQWQDAEDNEWECIHTQEEWEVGSQVGNDWAYPGSRWY
jgi:hypothetical protein